MSIKALEGKEFDTVSELVSAVFEIAKDDSHPEQEKAKEWINNLIKTFDDKTGLNVPKILKKKKVWCVS